MANSLIHFRYRHGHETATQEGHTKRHHGRFAYRRSHQGARKRVSEHKINVYLVHCTTASAFAAVIQYSDCFAVSGSF